MEKSVYKGAKRKAMVDRFGYDTKHAGHLIRLLRCACEFLETGELIVDRTGRDAEELKAIKRGEWGRERVLAEAERLFVRLEEARATSPLPEEPDAATADALLVEVTARHLEEALDMCREPR
jgi:hypothetical protein